MANSLQNPFSHISNAARKILPTNKGRIITRKTFVNGIKQEAAKLAANKNIYNPIGQKTIKRMAIAVATGTKLPNQGITNKELAFGKILRGAGDLKAGRFTSNVLSAVRTFEKAVTDSSGVTPEMKQTAAYKKKVAARIARRLPVKKDEIDAKNNRAVRSVSAAQVGRKKVEAEEEKNTPHASGGISNVIRLRHQATEKAAEHDVDDTLPDNVVPFTKSVAPAPEAVSEAPAVLSADPSNDNMSGAGDSDGGLLKAA